MAGLMLSLLVRIYLRSITRRRLVVERVKEVLNDYTTP